MISFNYDDALRKSHRTYDLSINIYIENSLSWVAEGSDESQEAELNSDQIKLLRTFLCSARDYCKANEIPPGTLEAIDVFEKAAEVAYSINYVYDGLPVSKGQQLALSPDQIKSKLSLAVPSHTMDLISHVEKHGKFGVLQDSLSAAVGNYIESNFKCQDIDRLLLKALTHVEIVAFIDEMTCKNVITGRSKLEDSAPPSVTKVLWNTFKLIFSVWFVICAVIAASSVLIPALPIDMMVVVGLSLAGLFTLIMLPILILALISMAKQKPRQDERRQSILNMLDLMNGFFLEFQGPGPFSLNHFKTKVHELADKQVMWPSALFVLVEDMEARGIKSF
jgi:hypothetical protein